MTYKSNLKLPNMPWRIQIISLFMKSIKKNDSIGDASFQNILVNI